MGQNFIDETQKETAQQKANGGWYPGASRAAFGHLFRWLG